MSGKASSTRCEGRCFPKWTLGSRNLKEATELLDLHTLLDWIADVAKARPAKYRYSFIDGPHVTRIARRCLLGRFPDEIERFREFWVANGASEEVVTLAAEAARCGEGRWPARIIEAGSQEAATFFSRAHADFVKGLEEIEHAEKAGPFGDAIQSSRYACGVGRCGSSLRGEFELSPGFPIVGLSQGFRESAWVETASEWPRWLADYESTLAADQLQESRREGLSHLRKLLEDVEVSVRKAMGGPQSPRASEGNGATALPEWLTLYALDFGVEGLDSAGLALALQRLADDQHRTIPSGVGFTGRWEDGRLQSVTGIRAKLRAAREAGIFALFACANQDEVKGLQQPVPEPGVILVFLPADSSLDDVVVRVNTICHDLGLTEYRWRRAVKTWEGQVLGNDDREELNRLLPYAAEKTCPVGFVGRDKLLSKLDQRKKEIEAQGGSGHIALVGSPRSGKTTTLSHWIFQREGMGPRPPVWFSFLRTKSHAELVG